MLRENCSSWAALAVLCWAAGASAEEKTATAQPIILPGQEDLVGQMLGTGPVQFPGGCAFDHADIQSSFINAIYSCGSRKVGIRLQHPSTAPFGATRTDKFAVVGGDPSPPGELVAAVADRIRARESAWRWAEPSPRVVEFPALLPSAPVPEEIEAKDAHPLTSAQLTAFSGLLKGMDTTPSGAFTGLLKLAAENPYHGVARALASSVIAFDDLEDTQARAYIAVADKEPASPAQQFVAGISAQHVADLHAGDQSVRQQMVMSALAHFDRALPAWDDVPELHLFRAITEVRLGRTKDAEADVARCLALHPDLMDAWYVRAEARQANPGDAISDLQEYVRRVDAGKKSPFAVDMIGTAKNEIARMEGKSRANNYVSVRRSRDFRGSSRFSRRRIWIMLGVLLLAAAAVGARAYRFKGEAPT